MSRFPESGVVVLSLFALCVVDVCGGNYLHVKSAWCQPAQAAGEVATTTTTTTITNEKILEAVPLHLPMTKEISIKALAKYEPISVTIEESAAEGKKEIKFTGVSLRVLFADMAPELKLESMPSLKALSRRELVLEVKGDDGYPGLLTAAEVAMNKSGDRYLLATHRDGKVLLKPQLICKLDEVHTRWVRDVVSLRILEVSK